MQHLSTDDLRKLFQAIHNPRWRLMAVVGYNHGLRVSELTALTGASIRDGYVNVKRLKGSEHTIQPYVEDPDPIFNERPGLEAMAKSFGTSDILFPITRNGFQKVLKAAGRRAGLPEHKCRPHSLKHSAAMESIRDMGIEYVRRWLGHKSLASTGHYLRVTDDEAGRAMMEMRRKKSKAVDDETAGKAMAAAMGG